MTGPLKEWLAEVEEALWAVDLYLGRDEQMVKLRDGEPAEATEPICVRQMVLAMDEECAVDAEGGGIDSCSIEEFDGWLQDDWAHVNQVIPEPKGVVVLVPRWRPKDTGNAGLDSAAAEANKRAYFLIRNGERLYRTWTDFDAGGEVVVPTSTEFTSYFEERVWDQDLGAYTRQAMRPGSDAWVKAEKAAEARQRHFMRVALILQGLVDRTTVFHPLHPAGVGFTATVHHREGRVRFILDAEKGLTTGRQPFGEWLAERNALLRPGMRIVGSFKGQAWRDADTTYRDRDGGWSGCHSRVYPHTADAPESGRIYVIEERRPNGDLVVRYPRPAVYDRTLWVESATRPGWGRYGGERPAKQRASVILRPGGPFVIPVDLVSVEECETYLSARGDRRSYFDMFPVLKAAVRAKRDEFASEAPFRVMMAGVLARENGVSVADAEEALPGLVDWYKLANAHHRPLVLGGEGGPLVVPAKGDYSGAKVVRFIVAEHKRRLMDQQRAGSPRIVAQLRERHPDALLIARTRSGPYVVLMAENDKNVFTRRLEYSAAGELREDRRWWLPGLAQLRWIVHQQSERWERWERAASAAEHLTDPERDEVVDPVRRSCGSPVLAVTEDREGRIDVWAVTAPARCDVAHLLTETINDPTVRTLAVRWSRHGGKVRVAALSRSGSEHSWHDRENSAPWDAAGGGRRVRGGGSVGDAYWSVLWEDPAALGKVRVDLGQLDKQRKEHDRLAGIVDAAAGSIRGQWERREHGRLYDRFLVDYGDPSLWEGHCKANPLPRYPHERRNVIRRALETLVEVGTLPWGMTVAAVVTEAQSDPDRYNWRRDHFETGTVFAPGDVAEFVFVAPDDGDGTAGAGGVRPGVVG